MWFTNLLVTYHGRIRKKTPKTNFQTPATGSIFSALQIWNGTIPKICQGIVIVSCKVGPCSYK